MLYCSNRSNRGAAPHWQSLGFGWQWSIVLIGPYMSAIAYVDYAAYDAESQERNSQQKLAATEFLRSYDLSSKLTHQAPSTKHQAPSYTVLQQWQCDRRQMIVLHPHLKFPFAEPGLQALAGLCLTGAADRLAALVEQDAVAAAERGQRADHVERLGEAL